MSNSIGPGENVPVVKCNFAIAFRLQLCIVERKYLSKDESGNTGNGSEDGRAGEASGRASDGAGRAVGARAAEMAC